MAPKTRARRSEDKDARRRTIIGCARAFLGQRPYADITLSDIARRAGLTKSALYLYFPSREALFLEVLGEDLQAWLDALHARLDSSPERWTPEALAELFMTPGGAGLVLMPMLNGILARSTDFDAVFRFEKMLHERTLALGERIERAAPFLPAGSGARFLVCAHAIVVGFRQHADCRETTDRVLKLRQLRALRPDLRPALKDVLTAVLVGWSASTGKKRSRSWRRTPETRLRSSASAAGFPATSSRPRISAGS
jgi:AcrR family transcriptional regulator